MTKVKNFPNQKKKQKIKVWLDLNTCRTIYIIFREEYKKNGDEPLPIFESRYPGRLESILESIKLRYAQFEPDARVEEIASDYFVRVTKSQSLVNGNKRMGVLFTSVFLRLNDYELHFSQEKLAELSLSVAESRKKIDKVQTEISRVFENKIKKTNSGFRISIVKFIQMYADRITSIKIPNPLTKH